MRPDHDTSPTRFGGMTRRSAFAALAAGLVFGGFAGGYAVSHAASAPTATPAPATAVPDPATSPHPGWGTGVFHPNEDPTHEKSESAAREAQETAGQWPTAP